MRKVSISASPSDTCKVMCDNQVPQCLTQQRPDLVVFTQPLEMCIQTRECSPLHAAVGWAMHLWAVTGCPASLLQQLCKDGLNCGQNTHFSGMLTPCQAHLCKHPSLRWQADEVSNRACIEPFLEPLCHCVASYSSEDDAVVFSRTILLLSSYSQVMVRWLGHSLVMPSLS